MAEQKGTEFYQSPYKFNGKELDEETGLYYYVARYYDPKVSMFLSVDPLAEKYPNVNPYAYCFQNPINMIDPTGMEGQDPDDPSRKSWISRTWSKIKGWFSSKDDYQDVTAIVYAEEAQITSHIVSTIGCHPAPNGNMDQDLWGELRDFAGDIDTANDYIDAIRQVAGKRPILGKYGDAVSFATSGVSVGADYMSESSKNEFLQNKIITSSCTAVGYYLGTTAEISLGTVLNNGAEPDGLINLSNGRLAESYSSSYNQTQSYLRNNFYNRSYPVERYKTNDTINILDLPKIMYQYWTSDQFKSQFNK